MTMNAWYPVTAFIGLLVAVVLSAVGLKRRCFHPLHALSLSASGLVMAVILGKFFYLIFNTQLFALDGISCVVRLLPSEFSFTGFLAGFVLGIALAARLWKLPVPQILDCFAVPVCILAAFLRFAELFAGELGLAEMSTFGLEEISEGSAAAFFPLAIRDSWDQWLLALSSLEALCIMLAVLFLRLFRTSSEKKKVILQEGMFFELTLFTVCTFGFFFETAKISGVVFYFVYTEQLLSALVMLALTIRLSIRLSHVKVNRPWLPPVLFLLCVALNAFAQYFMDKAWRFSDLFPESVFIWLSSHLSQICYSVMLLTAIASFVIYFRSIRKAAKSASR